MAFGAPTRYWKLNPAKALNGADGWDKGVAEASTIYNGRIVGHFPYVPLWKLHF